MQLIRAGTRCRRRILSLLFVLPPATSFQSHIRSWRCYWLGDERYAPSTRLPIRMSSPTSPFHDDLEQSAAPGLLE
jgi:hypothetical protein